MNASIDEWIGRLAASIELARPWLQRSSTQFLEEAARSGPFPSPQEGTMHNMSLCSSLQALRNEIRGVHQLATLLEVLGKVSNSNPDRLTSWQLHVEAAVTRICAPGMLVRLPSSCRWSLADLPEIDSDVASHEEPYVSYSSACAIQHAAHCRASESNCESLVMEFVISHCIELLRFLRLASGKSQCEDRVNSAVQGLRATLRLCGYNFMWHHNGDAGMYAQSSNSGRMDSISNYRGPISTDALSWVSPFRCASLLGSPEHAWNENASCLKETEQSKHVEPVSSMEQLVASISNLAAMIQFESVGLANSSKRSKVEGVLGSATRIVQRLIESWKTAFQAAASDPLQPRNQYSTDTHGAPAWTLDILRMCVVLSQFLHSGIEFLFLSFGREVSSHCTMQTRKAMMNLLWTLIHFWDTMPMADLDVFETRDLSDVTCSIARTTLALRNFREISPLDWPSSKQISHNFTSLLKAALVQLTRRQVTRGVLARRMLGAFINHPVDVRPPQLIACSTTVATCLETRAYLLKLRDGSGRGKEECRRRSRRDSAVDLTHDHPVRCSGVPLGSQMPSFVALPGCDTDLVSNASLISMAPIPPLAR